MPGPAIHHLIAKELKQRIQSGNGLGDDADYEKLQELLTKSENFPYLFLGCQGPDFLFFNTKDWTGLPLGDAVKIYYEVYDAIDDIKETLKGLVPQPVIDALEALDAAADAVVENSSTLTELEQLFGDMQQVVDGLLANLTEMIKKFITDFNLYDLLEHPYRDGQTKGEWWWFDAMHYRKTGRFAQALVDKTSPDSPLHLYALGYLTHVTGDTVGHPFVNINSGGAYRTQSQRHKTGENFQDVFHMFQHTSGTDWNRSQLHAFYNFNFTGNIAPIDAANPEPDRNTQLPDDLADLIADTMNEIYNTGNMDDNEYGRTISKGDVDAAYRLWYKWMRSATETGTLPEPIPYSLTEELEEVWETAMDNLGDIGDFLEDAADLAGSFNILAIFIILAALIIAAVAAALALIDAVLGALTTLTVAGIRYAACLIYEHLYNAFQTFRLGVSFNGLAYPMTEHMNEVRFDQFKNTSFDDPFGFDSRDLKGSLPKLKVLLDGGGFLDQLFHKEKHLVYPPTSETASEPNAAIPGPDSYFQQDPLHYAFGNIPLDRKFIDFLTQLEGDEQKLKDYLATAIKEKRGLPTLGNAMDLTEELYDRLIKNKEIPEFNLDADRGYAYTCWTQKDESGPNAPEAPKELLQNDQQQNGQAITPVKLDFIGH
ncbi:zinc dependent phospholipase C family protein [Arenibacter algicola]|uniref:zinc dependent phospholipase C family protein n=1 Tax=Arenibacter algicola TaxID=616991 RepID=UPI001C07012A|nr:zinc dependent phospholipase C family protein [Arenibacter algicola]MBU2905556.1 zinc dependent phospholipase C family protein [Arenibacter algicola]